MEASMTMMADGRGLDPRLIFTRSWWLATMLCRRHSDLAIIEYHPGGGQYECLGLYSATEKKVLVDLNRTGSIHCGGPESEGSMPWADAFVGEPFKTVLRLEEGLRNRPSTQLLPTTRKLLTYRVLTAFATVGSTERFYWDISSAFLDTSGYGGGARHELFTMFPGAAGRRDSYPENALGDPAYRFWVLSRSGKPEIMLDDEGIVYRPSKDPQDLYESFGKCGRQLWRLMGQEFGAELG